MSADPPETLRAALAASTRLDARWLYGASADVRLADLAASACLDADLTGRSVLLRVADPLSAALALVALDGVARRIVLCPPDLTDEALPGVMATAGIEAIAFDESAPVEAAGLIAARIALPSPSSQAHHDPFPLTGKGQGMGVSAQAAKVGRGCEPANTELALPPPPPPRRGEGSPKPTEWVMFTSGTSGPPKLVTHTLAGLTGAIRPSDDAPIWGTFYDIRRYGGLQMLLRALVGAGSLVVGAPAEPFADYLTRAARLGVTHLTGTPSHWRRALMSLESRALNPAYVRLSGEIADQAVLDALKARFPRAPIGHAYASTEAGVGFEVNDGLEGFPAEFVGRPGAVELKIVDGALALRSGRTAGGYLNTDAPALDGADGFVDSGDMVELRGARYHFVGRRNGVINVGGLKAHPEEIEAVINRHPAVRASLVKSRKSPITGAIAIADVVLADAGADEGAVRAEIIEACRRELAPFKTPAMIRFVAALPMTAGGKLDRAAAPKETAVA
jgi:hypothetical protein